MSVHACATWDFRITKRDLSHLDVIQGLEGIAKQYVFQLEEGDSGYIHYQGRMSLIKKRRATEKQKILDLFQTWKPEYLQPTTNPEHQSTSFSYVIKADTRIAGPWTDADKPKDVYIPRQYRNINPETDLRPFQQTIWNNTQNPDLFDSRSINLVYCERGNKGKSTIAHLCRIKANCIVIPAIINDAKELIQVACDMCMDSKNRCPNTVFVDLPRAINKDRLYGLYSAIEVIKDGYLYDVRHHFKCWDIDSPHVWVFTNVMPDLAMLSLDRWNVWTIDECSRLMHYEPYIGDVLPRSN